MGKVLVTGGAGYIGSILVRMLIDNGYQVRVLDRFYFTDHSLENIKNKAELIRGDIRNVGKGIFDNVDTVMDLAAISNDPAGEIDPQKTIDINYLGRARIAQLAKLAGVKKYILASSCSVYGFQDGILDEQSAVNPLTTYAEANYLAEKAVLSLADENYTVSVLRQATVYGFSYRMRFDIAVNGMVGAYYKLGRFKVLRDGSQWRPFVHVKDTSKAFTMVMESNKEKVNGQIFNVGANDLNIQILELAKKVAKGLNKPFEYEWYGEPDMRSYRVSFDKINMVLGYTTEYDFEAGAIEIWNEMEKGTIRWDDPKTKTVNWYKTLLDWNQHIKSVVGNNGEIL
ncbi:MAG: NAD-dependent epimerase/dehydratase family protein [Deltaproteobacteria bacterium]